MRYGPTLHPRMVDLGLGQDEMLRGIKHEAEAIRKQSEELVGSTRAPDVVPLSFEDGVWARRAKHATHGIEPVAK